MIKVVTCGAHALARAMAKEKIDLGTDVTVVPTGKIGELAVRGQTLTGQLFLSLLVAGAIG